MENKIYIICNSNFQKMLIELFTFPWIILFFSTILTNCFGQCNPGCPIPLPQPCQRSFPPPPSPLFPSPIPSQNCQPFPQQPCVQRPPSPYPHLPQIPPPAPIGPYLTNPSNNGEYQTNLNHQQQQYQIYPPSSFHQSTSGQQYGFGGYGYGGGGRPLSPSSPYYTGQYTSNVYPIPASEKLVPPSSLFGDIKSNSLDDHNNKDPFEREDSNRKESSSVEEEKGRKMASSVGGHQHDPSMYGGYRISPSPIPHSGEGSYGIRPPLPNEGKYGYGIRPPLPNEGKYGYGIRPPPPLSQLPVVYPTPQVGGGNPFQHHHQPCGPTPCPPQPLPMPQLPCPPPPPMPLPQPCPPSLPPPPMPLPCPVPPQPLPPPPPPMPLPLPPIQNCCLQCGRPCLNAIKMMDAKKAMAAKSATKSGILERILQQGDVDGIGKEIDNEFGEQCNDLGLAQIIEEMRKMGMAEAKEKIRSRAEQLENQMAKNDEGKQVEIVTTIFHVFCGPKPMEYVIRADRFCAGRVTDGICFVFGTVRQ